MKNVFKKSLCIAVLSVMLAVLMAFQAPVMRVSAAGDPYISDLQIIVAADYETAKTKATEGYTVVQEPLYAPNKELKDPGESTFLSYKTTDKKEDAIFDIKTVTMNDGYSYSKYASYLEQQYDFSEDYVKSIAPAIQEFQKNYRLHRPLAETVYTLLSCFVDGDSGYNIGDLFLQVQFKTGKTTGAGTLEEESLKALIPVFMQGNSEIVIVIQQLLLIACGSIKEHTWLQYLDEMADDGDTFKIASEMDYADEVKLFKQQIPEIQSDIKYYLNCENAHPFTAQLEAEMNTQEALFQTERAKAENAEKSDNALRTEIAHARAEELPDGIGAEYLTYYLWKLNEGAERAIKWETGKKLYNGLTSYNYPLEGYETFYDLFMADPDTTPKTDYYPIISSMTAGQRGLAVLGSKQMALVALTPNDEYIEQLESWLDGQSEITEDNTLSVYAGVDRSIYDADGIAMTEHALEYMRYGTDSPFENTFNDAAHQHLSILMYSIMGLAVVTVFVIIPAVLAGITAHIWNVSFFSALASTYLQSVAASFSSSLIFLTIAIFIILAMVVVVDYLWETIWNNRDIKYESIPRIICSREDTMYKGIDENGNNVFGGGYVYYYGVKNPNQPATIDSGAQTGIDTSNGVMDIYNWSLSGSDRKWVALYYTKDQRVAYMDASQTVHRQNPIKAGSLAVSSEKKDGVSVTTDFTNTASDLLFIYQRTHATRLDTTTRYLYKAHYTDAEFTDLQLYGGSGSVFADNAPLAFGGGGLVLGAVGGTFVTLAAKKKKKSAAEEQA